MTRKRTPPVPPRSLVKTREALERERGDRARVAKALRDVERSIGQTIETLTGYERGLVQFEDEAAMADRLAVLIPGWFGGMEMGDVAEAERLAELRRALDEVRAKVATFKFPIGDVDAIDALDTTWTAGTAPIHEDGSLEAELAAKAARDADIEPLPKLTRQEFADAIGIEDERLKKRRRRRKYRSR